MHISGEKDDCAVCYDKAIKYLLDLRTVCQSSEITHSRKTQNNSKMIILAESGILCIVRINFSG